jgi:hypothetical protein
MGPSSPEPTRRGVYQETPRVPCLNTYRNVLGQINDMSEFEPVVHDFLAAQPGAGQSVVISLDGKTLRGTLPASQRRGLHLLAAYPSEGGWVLAQVEVGGKESVMATDIMM